MHKGAGIVQLAMLCIQLRRLCLCLPQAVHAAARYRRRIVIAGNQRQQCQQPARAVVGKRRVGKRRQGAWQQRVSGSGFGTRTAQAVCMKKTLPCAVLRHTQFGRQLRSQCSHLRAGFIQTERQAVAVTPTQHRRPQTKGENRSLVGVHATGGHQHGAFRRFAYRTDGMQQGGRRTAGVHHAKCRHRGEKRGDGLRALYQQRHIHIGMTGMIFGIDQSGFGGQTGFALQGATHACGNPRGVRLPLPAHQHGRLQFVQGMTAFARADFGILRAQQAAARRIAELPARQRLALAIQHVHIPQASQGQTLFHGQKQALDAIGRRVHAPARHFPRRFMQAGTGVQRPAARFDQAGKHVLPCGKNGAAECMVFHRARSQHAQDNLRIRTVAAQLPLPCRTPFARGKQLGQGDGFAGKPVGYGRHHE